MGEKTVVFLQVENWSGFWLLRKLPGEKDVRILNVKSCLQNFKATIKDTIIFHLGNNEIPCFT